MEETQIRISTLITFKNTMSCNNRLCHNAQHGLMTWLGNELSACYRRRDDLEVLVQTKNEQMDDMLGTIDEQSILITQFERANQDLMRRTVRNALENRILKRARVEDLRQIEMLTQQVAMLKAEGKALARALRAKPPMGEWIPKKQKTEQ